MHSRPRTSLKTAALLVASLTVVQAHAILGGTADTDPNSVYRYMGQTAGVGGTPISSQWIVTAAHVAPSVGQTYTNADGTFNITQVVNEPNGADISLFKISGTLAHFYAYANLTGVTPVALVGYGHHSAIGTDPSTSSTGARYIAYNTIDAQGGTNLPGGPTFQAYAYDLDDGTAAHNVYGSATPVAGEGGIADGDSGGGWFATINGQPTIVAVSSGVDSLNDATGSGSSNYYDYGGSGVGADLGAYSAFIQQTTGVAPVPEPSAFAALGFGTLAMLRRRKRA